MMLLPYLLKVILCSSLLMAYYYIALRNKVFHQWNRFFLLATIMISLIIPCFTFTFFHTSAEKSKNTIQILQAVSSGDEYVVHLTARPSLQKLFIENGPSLFYISITLVLLALFLRSLFKIKKLISKHEVKKIDDINFISTEVKGAPFSFLNYLFWNPSIPLNTSTGQQVFHHEAAHIREHHTLDKLFVQMVLVVFWCNPIFWLIRQELRMVHEFIADKKAVAHRDTAALAAMILQAAYPQQFNTIINSFFNQSIKRRLHMLTKIQNPRMSYISRIFFIPVIAVLVLAFSVRTKEKAGHIYTGDKKMTVIVDAGHGGADAGAGSQEHLEKDIALSLAKQVKAANNNPQIEIILTRSNDATLNVQDRLAMAEKLNADLFISLHLNAAPATRSTGGIEIVVPREKVSYQEKSFQLGSALARELNSIYKTAPRLLQRNTTIGVLDKNVCPAVLIECGYITNEKDLDFMRLESNQKLIAEKILNGVETFLQSKENTSSPGITSTEAPKALPVPATAPGKQQPAKVSEKVHTSSSQPAIASREKQYQQIEQPALATSFQPDTSKPAFVKVEKEAEFPGGTHAWRNFLQKTLNASVPVDKGASAGSYTVILQFIVDVDGSIMDVSALTKHGFGMEEEVIRMMQASPKWIPARQNGRAVASYKKQPVTFVIADANNDAP